MSVAIHQCVFCHPECGQEPFVTWAFTRTPEHCEVMTNSGSVHGCTVVENKHVTMEGFLTYCERTLGHFEGYSGSDW